MHEFTPENLDTVALERLPRTYALYSQDDADEQADTDAGVVRWAFTLPSGRTIIMGYDGRGETVITNLCSAAERWAPLYDAELVTVTDNQNATARQ